MPACSLYSPTKDNYRHGAIFAPSGLVDWSPLDISGANQCEDPLPQSHRPVLGLAWDRKHQSATIYSHFSVDKARNTVITTRCEGLEPKAGSPDDESPVLPYFPVTFLLWTTPFGAHQEASSVRVSALFGPIESQRDTMINTG